MIPKADIYFSISATVNPYEVWLILPKPSLNSPELGHPLGIPRDIYKQQMQLKPKNCSE